MTKHYVYLIAGPETVKIGHSARPTARLNACSTGSSDSLSLTHKWEMSRPEAIAFEARLHGLFKWCRVRGEWFQLDWQVVRQIGDMLLAGHESRAAAILADLAEWRRLRPDDLAGRCAALKRAYRQGLVLVNEWDAVYLE